MFLGALSFAAVWLFAAKQVEKDRSASKPVASGPASTSGSNSPAVSGNGNDIHYDQSHNPEKKTEPPK
jgi:hypothetical protein